VESQPGIRPPDDHDGWAELAGAYVLDALEPPERARFEAHLVTCADCAAEVRSLAAVVDTLALASEEADPSPAVRQRILTSIASTQTRLPAAARVGPARPRADAGWLAAAALLLLAVGAGAYALQLRGRVTDLETRLSQAVQRAALVESQIADARRTAAQSQASVAVLTAPDVARIDLKGQPAAPDAMARAFWSRSRGLVFTGTNLPALPARQTYQLWVITADPAPISAGLLMPDAEGRVTGTFETPPDIPQPVAMAVTLEPENGVPAPTGDKYLVGSAN
jgi:anti-sigma-K factor RskA